MKKIAIALTLVLLAAISAQAMTVEVQILGEVEYSGINSGPFAGAGPGDPANITFTVDSENYVDSSSFNVRGYVIDESSFQFTFGSHTAGMQNPYPGTPYFCVRESDPVADGFFVGTDGLDWPSELWSDVPGQIGQFGPHFEVGYEGDTLASLDILAAAGSYGYDGLTSFWYAIFDGWAEAGGMLFTELTITPLTTATDDTSWGQVKSLY